MNEETVYPPSPVPADERLRPGEKPFTAFGQFGPGQMDKRVFEQDVYWVDITGTPHLIDEMSEEYRINVVMFLRDDVDYFFLGALERMVAGIIIDEECGYLDANPDILEYQLTESTIADMTAEEWLESTPLMRKLLKTLETPETP